LLLFAFPIIIFDFITQLITALIPYSDAQKYASVTVQTAAGISGFLLLLILSPLFSIVSDETGEKLSGKSYRFSLPQLVKDIIRGVKITLRNLLYQYVTIAFIYLILYLLPEMKLFQIIGSVSIFIITAYFYGFSILDYAMENQRMNYQTSVKFVRSHPGIAIGLGSIYYGIISLNNLPYLQNSLGHFFNVYWSGFAEALVAFMGVIAAAIMMHKKKNIIKTQPQKKTHPV
jgi:uncharacterized protein involved in cysteine biosynthesis